MSSPADDSLLTRRTLLSRLRNLDDQESWRKFFDRYWRLLYNVARRSGLDDSGTQEIVQDTVIAVARKIPEFRYDPERGKEWPASKVAATLCLNAAQVYLAQAMRRAVRVINDERSREFMMVDPRLAGGLREGMVPR